MTYKIFVDGKFISKGTDYSEVFQRALGIALYLGMKTDYLNTKAKTIIDKWKNKHHCIIVYKD